MRKGKKKSEIISPRERLLLLIENTKEYAIIILDSKGRIEDWNYGAKHLLGYSEREIVGRSFEIFFTQDDKKNKKPEFELKRAQEEGRAEDDNWLVRKDGSRFWASGLTVAIVDKLGNQVGFAKIIRDLTDKQELEKQKDDFIAIASHELRTPLTVASLHRQMLDKRLQKINDKKAIAYFNQVTHAVNQLDHLIRDLLNVTKIQTSTVLEKEIFSIGEIVKGVASEVQKTTNNHKIIIQGDAKSKVDANKSQIEQVITNLLTNAIKYSPKAKKVVVNLKENKSTIQISVRDYGIGIHKRNLLKVFGRFYRTPESRNQKLPGLGLGYISQKKL